ncbi:MAG: DUF6591 domain-containing protein [Anaerovoracaceae bacterium]
MKKVAIWILLVLLVLSFVGCGVKEKIGEKAGEALAEKILEESGAEDVDIDGDTITIKGEDGEEMVFGQTEWPSSDLAKSIPEFKDGKIVTVMEMNDSILIGMEEVDAKDAAKYFEELKKDFTEDTYEINSEGSAQYMASNGEVGISVFYDDNETLSITVALISE